MDINQIFQNNQNWLSEKLAKNANYFKDLSLGQKPEILYIGCSDSRVTAEELMGAEPGEAFIHRNIANMVHNLDLSAMSVIEYATNHLKVNHIIICGHYDCGGVKAAMQSKDLGVLNPWLRGIRDVYRIHQEELSSIGDEDDRYKRLVELNVEEQCINVLKIAAVQLAVRQRGISVHGWVFDIKTGRLIDLKIDFMSKVEKIRQIYRLE